jgi:hypothetical protein
MHDVFQTIFQYLARGIEENHEKISKHIWDPVRYSNSGRFSQEAGRPATSHFTFGTPLGGAVF